MRSRLPLGMAVVLMTILMADAQKATAAEPGRLAAFTARQRLRDEVCIALADGHIDRGERYAILSHAKPVLKAEEYEGLKRTLDRLSPQPKPATTQSVVNTPVDKTPGSAEQKAPSLAGNPLGPAIPADAILPDRVAWDAGAR